jgi:hypothetical protein
MSQSPATGLNAKQAWEGRTANVQLLGRKHVNGAAFTETWPVKIHQVNNLEWTFGEVLQEALRLAAEKSDIAPDLVEGFSFKFTSAQTNHE